MTKRYIKILEDAEITLVFLSVGFLIFYIGTTTALIFAAIAVAIVTKWHIQDILSTLHKKQIN